MLFGDFDQKQKCSVFTFVQYRYSLWIFAFERVENTCIVGKGEKGTFSTFTDSILGSL